jgi:hypothetical protein
MALGVNNPIVSGDIYHIKMFKDLKVFLLIGADNDKVVIKTDAVHAPQIKSANPIIKAIAPSAKLKILTPPELAAVKQACETYEYLAREYKEWGIDWNADEAPAVKSLKESLGFGFPFVKMEAVNVTDLSGALESRLGGDKRDIRTFTATLNASGGLETLGKIIAVDMFNGNTDRFYPGSASTKTVGGVDFNLKCLVNVGNVFHVNTAAGSEVGALDFVDPNSMFKNINQALSDIEEPGDKKTWWPARILADRSKRKDFAKDVVHDLEKILSPHKSKFSLKTKLNFGAADRIDKGMVEGAKAIKIKLEQKYGPNNWTPAIRERYQIICQVK